LGRHVRSGRILRRPFGAAIHLLAGVGIVLHVVLRGVGRVLVAVRIGRAGRGNGWIYRDCGVRIAVAAIRMMMAVGVAICQVH
jgi:hypothetical protein